MGQASAEDKVALPAQLYPFGVESPGLIQVSSWTEQPGMCSDVAPPAGMAALRGHSTQLPLCNLVRGSACLNRKVLKTNFGSRVIGTKEGNETWSQSRWQETLGEGL